ncbi:MAG: hypothetical protein ACK52A_06535 [Planctomycetota bacterium]
MNNESQPWEPVASNAADPGRTPLSPPGAEQAPESTTPSRQMGWLDRLLDPETLQRMMACGGGLLILGFIVWLWSCGVFENPRVLAVAVGSVNLVLIGVGIMLVRSTRYQLTGQGLALLGSLALPLNLWLYHAQGLIVISAGGHLWVPALACCLIYAAVARSLRNPRFVYALVAGVILTGLLFLADRQVNRFWEVLPVATLLATIGSVCAVAANFFPTAGDFSRDRFGKAFLRAGQITLTSGLTLLAGGQLLALLAERIPFTDFLPVPTDLLASGVQKWWASGLTLGALAVHVLLGLGRTSLFNRTSSIALAGWTIGNILLALDISLTLQAFIIGLSLLVVAMNVARLARRDWETAEPETRFPPLGQWMGSLSSAGLALWSVCHFAWAISGDLNHLGQVEWTVWTTIQFALAGLACWTSDRLWWSRSVRLQTLVPIYLGSFALSLAAVTLIATAGLTTLPLALLGPALMGLAITIAGFWLAAETGPSWRHAALGCVTAVIALAVLNVATAPRLFSENQLHWILIGLLNAAICGWLSVSQRSATASIGFALLLSFSTAEAISLTSLSFDYSLLVALSGLGLTSRLISRFSRLHPDGNLPEGLGGNLLGVCGGLGSVLLALSELASGEATLGLLGFLALQAILSGLLSLLTRSEGLAMTFRPIAYSCIVLAGIVLFQVADLNPAQKVELLAASIGLLILALSHWGLYREQIAAKTDEAVTLGLWLGSVTAVIPLLAGLFVYRSGVVEDPAWLWGHELGVLLAGLSMFGIGSLLQTRATTLVGGTTLLLYVSSLLFLVPWPDQLQSTSVLMMILGGLFFLVAILLSAYRERLVQIPEKMKTGEGIYQVLKWR